MQSPISSPSDMLWRKRSRRARFIKWLRTTHMYLGLWGAVLGLLFGVTGILMNHRHILKIPVEKAVQTTVQLALPEEDFASPDQLAAWLQSELKFTPMQTPPVRVQPAKTVQWGAQQVHQPELWTIFLHSPKHGVNAEYFVGNRFVKLDQIDATLTGTLMRLHTATGVNAFWVLLSDTIAGSFILLSITGLLLWTQLRKVRTIGVLISIGATITGVWFLI